MANSSNPIDIQLLAFAHLLHKTSPSPWTYQSNRQVLDLYAFGYRDYDPTLGRFLTPDPAGFADGLNLYAFTLNSPLTFIDPYGIQADFYDRLRSDYDRTRDPVRDSPIGLGAIRTRDRIAARERLRTSLHGVESALRHLPTHRVSFTDQSGLFPGNTPYQLPENLVMGVYDPNASFETNLGYAEIILGIIMSKGSDDFKFGGGGVLISALMTRAGCVFIADGILVQSYRLDGKEKCVIGKDL